MGSSGVCAEGACTTKDLARRSRNRISEYLPQRRQDRKGRTIPVKIIRNIFIFPPPNLATLRLGGSNFRLRVLSASRSFAQAGQNITDSNTKSTKERRLERKERDLLSFQTARTTATLTSDMWMTNSCSGLSQPFMSFVIFVVSAFKRIAPLGPHRNLKNRIG